MIPDVPKFRTKKELFAWLKDNEEDILYQKKSTFKKADAFSTTTIALLDSPEFAQKNGVPLEPLQEKEGNVDIIKRRVIINTTMVRDSHKDVHLNGLWNKSLKENRNLKHLQEHEMKFDKIIADKDDLHAFTKTYSWRDLGYDVDGKTEALVFDSTIKQSRNATMFREYKDGNVDNHSVGMYYVNIKLALDSDDEGDEKYKAEYDKWINDIANKAEVEKEGYFFAVYEAKAIEGSAVPIGSNRITPTLQPKEEREELTENQIKANAIMKWLKQ